VIKLTVTDGGATQEGFLNEWNDCSVRALALSTGIGYAKAHSLLKAEGRRNRRGTKLRMIRRALEKIGQFQELTPSGPIGGYLTRPRYPTLQDTVRKYSTGRYLIVATGHALALIDGIVHDKGQISGPRSRVRNIFRITLTEPVSTIPNQSQINELWARLDKLEGK